MESASVSASASASASRIPLDLNIPDQEDEIDYAAVGTDSPVPSNDAAEFAAYWMDRIFVRNVAINLIRDEYERVNTKILSIAEKLVDLEAYEASKKRDCPLVAAAAARKAVVARIRGQYNATYQELQDPATPATEQRWLRRLFLQLYSELEEEKKNADAAKLVVLMFYAEFKKRAKSKLQKKLKDLYDCWAFCGEPWAKGFQELKESREKKYRDLKRVLEDPEEDPTKKKAKVEEALKVSYPLLEPWELDVEFVEEIKK